MGRMGGESHHYGNALMMRGVFLRRVDDFLMSEVDAIKHAHSERDGSWQCGESVDGSEYLHAESLQGYPWLTSLARRRRLSSRDYLRLLSRLHREVRAGVLFSFKVALTLV